MIKDESLSMSSKLERGERVVVELEGEGRNLYGGGLGVIAVERRVSLSMGCHVE